MDITLLYFDDCPNWRVAVVDTLEEAERVGFHGSPSILVDGVDVFAEPDAGVGLSCRVYRTPEGLAGAPTMEQLRAALADVGGTVR
jgi:protein-disulfide isomerase